MTSPIIIAAGGHGTRIGGKKEEQCLGGIALLQRAVTFAFSQTDTVAIAAQTGTTSVHTDPPLPILYDREQDAGPLAALESGLDFAASNGAASMLMIGCDMPFLPTDLLARLCAVAPRGKVAMTASIGRWHPICALWPVTACLNALPHYAAQGNSSLHGLARMIGMVEIEWDGEPVDPFFNINTVDDLAQAELLLAQNAKA